MLAGTIVSAVLGGIAGLVYAVTQDQGIAHGLLAYQMGGMIAVLAFIALAQPSQPRKAFLR